MMVKIYISLQISDLMLAYVKDIIPLANRYGTKIKVEDLLAIPLHYQKTSNTWIQMLCSRVKLFEHLRLISFVLDDEFLIGYDGMVQMVDIDENRSEEIDSLGPFVIDEKFEGSAVFDYLLRYEFAMLIIKDLVRPETAQCVSKDRVVKRNYDDNWRSESSKEIFISLGVPLIITSDFLYIDPKHPMLEAIKSLLKEHHTEGDKFIAKYKDKVYVPHSLYVEWLMKWFPGRIHIRSLQ